MGAALLALEAMPVLTSSSLSPSSRRSQGSPGTSCRRRPLTGTPRQKFLTAPLKSSIENAA